MVNFFSREGSELLYREYRRAQATASCSPLFIVFATAKERKQIQKQAKKFYAENYGGLEENPGGSPDGRSPRDRYILKFSIGLLVVVAKKSS